MSDPKAAADGLDPLDAVPENIPFDVPYGSPMSLERAQAAINAVVIESRKRDWK
jgi:glc operon protein GlcG